MVSRQWLMFISSYHFHLSLYNFAAMFKAAVWLCDKIPVYLWSRNPKRPHVEIILDSVPWFKRNNNVQWSCVWNSCRIQAWQLRNFQMFKLVGVFSDIQPLVPPAKISQALQRCQLVSSSDSTAGFPGFSPQKGTHFHGKIELQIGSCWVGQNLQQKHLPVLLQSSSNQGIIGGWTSGAICKGRCLGKMINLQNGMAMDGFNVKWEKQGIFGIPFWPL